MAELKLASDFPAAQEAEWQALIAEALKGASFASLRSRSYDGIVIEPLYARPKDARPIATGRPQGEPWAVMQLVDLPDASAANVQLLEDLSNGANGLVLVFEGSIGDYGYALPPTEEAIARALQDVHLDAGIAVELELGPACKDTALMLASLVKTKGIGPEKVDIRFGFDPIGVLAASGSNNLPWTSMAP